MVVVALISHHLAEHDVHKARDVIQYGLQLGLGRVVLDDVGHDVVNLVGHLQRDEEVARVGCNVRMCVCVRARACVCVFALP